MTHIWKLPVAALALAVSLAAPATAQSALDEARIEVQSGRAVYVGGEKAHLTMRRDDTHRAAGPSHFEISVGGRARISWTGTMSIDVFGPAIVEWRASGKTVDVDFERLSWADVEVRRGWHTIDLPSDWQATVGRSSVHFRGLAGGPTEVRSNGGVPVEVQWRGEVTQTRPPVSVYPGSSVRLDRPRFAPQEIRAEMRGGQGAAWDVSAEDLETGETVWPWRERSDTPAQTRERLVLSRETRRMDEAPGSPTGRIERVRAYESDGASTVREIAPRKTEPVTSSQVGLFSERAPRVERVQRVGRRQEAARSTMPPRERAPQMPVRESSDAQGDERDDSGAGDTLPEKKKAPIFDSAQWRGLSRSSLNGAGAVAAEKAVGVEVRILGGGRTKVFVSRTAKDARWCFTPFADYRLEPGAVMVFEQDGTLRMNFGPSQELKAAAGRPMFSDLPSE